MLAGVGHDLKTHLTRMRLQAEIIDDEKSHQSRCGEHFQSQIDISPVAKNNVTILSSTHCSAPSAWPLQSNIIGFSQFWRKLLIFRTRNIYKIERPFIKKYLRF